MLSHLSAELQYWLPRWRCPLRSRWLCWFHFQIWQRALGTHQPLRPCCLQPQPDVSCQLSRGGRSWRGSAGCPPGWTLGHIYHTGKVFPLRQRHRAENQLKTKKKDGISKRRGHLLISYTRTKPHNRISSLPVWMIMCFDRSPTLTNALLHIWHLCGRTLSWWRMWLASWLDCTNLWKESNNLISGYKNRLLLKNALILLADLLPQRSHT